MSFALFLAKNVHLSIDEEFCAILCQKFCTSVSPLLNGAEFTLSVAKNVALFETVRILRTVKWRDWQGIESAKQTMDFPAAPFFLVEISKKWIKLRKAPLDLSFWSFLTFLHHGIEKAEGHLLWKFHKKIQRKSWSNVPPKLLACIVFLYKVVHKNGRLRKFNRSREIEFNFFTAWTIFMTLSTLVHHVHGYKTLPHIFNFCLGT